jgi:phage shock protein B
MEGFPFVQVFGGLLALAAVIAICVIPLLVIGHYTVKWKSMKGLSRDEERLLEDLWRDSQSFESRLNALETILDDEVPNWRSRI